MIPGFVHFVRRDHSTPRLTRPAGASVSGIVFGVEEWVPLSVRLRLRRVRARQNHARAARQAKKARAMRRRNGSTVGVSLALAALALPRPAQAQVPTIRLNYSVVEGCPSESEFEQRVHLRSTKVMFTPDESAGRFIEIGVQADGGGYSGTLRLVTESGVERSRNLRATTCTDAIDGLALMTVVALDPDAIDSPAASAPAPEAAPSAPPERPSPPPVPTIQRSSRRPVLRDWRASGGIEAIALWGVAPLPLRGGLLYLTVEHKFTVWLTPTIRGALLKTEHRSFGDSGNGVGDFGATLASVEGCPFRVGTDGFSLRPCFLVMGGAVAASGEHVSNPESYSRARWDLGPSTLLMVRIGSHVEVVVNAALIFPLRRDRYQFAPDVFFVVPAYGAIVGAGVGFTFL